MKLAVVAVLLFACLSAASDVTEKKVSDSSVQNTKIEKQEDIRVVRTVGPRTNWSKVKDLFK